MHTLRFADVATAARYPLPIQGPLPWVARDDLCAAVIALPDLPAGSIVVPSLALPDDPPRRYRWSLVADGVRWTLPDVPASPVPPSSRATTGDARVTLHVDCFHVHQPLAEPALVVALEGLAVPARYLAAASARPLSIDHVAGPGASAGRAEAPPAISQMSAHADLRARICSPTSVAMLLAARGGPSQWPSIVDECRDPATGMYGVWPLAIAAAARRGVFGAVETFTRWEEPLAVLARGIPLVASIRYESGELPGAPLVRTGGHLLVVYAADPESVRVNDPAAPDGASVTRSYPAAAFTRAWLGYRGAAYILPS